MRLHVKSSGAAKLATGVAFLAALAAALTIAPAAGAAITATTITTPSKPAFYIVNNTTNTPSITVAGTVTGATSGDTVDIDCYYGNGSSKPFATNVPVSGSGKFSATAVPSKLEDGPCILRAVPSGTTPVDLSPFHGVEIGVGESDASTNAGAVYDYYIFAPQSHAADDYLSASGCGIDDGYLYDSSLVNTTTTWYCDDYYWNTTADRSRSEIQVDGSNAFGPASAENINSGATGLPVLKFSSGIDAKTGNTVIHESDPIVKCTNPTFPATPATCTSFVSTGVTDNRTITQDHNGDVVWITDVFKSTDGKSHKVDLLWENDNHFHGLTGSATDLEYEFPGQKSYATHLVGDNVSLPKRSGGTIFIRMQGAADGDTGTGRGAIVYDRPATAAEFTYVSSDYSAFLLHQTVTVPKKGSAQLRDAYVQSFAQKTVSSLAKLATLTFKGCTVPKVTGKTLAAAKKAIVRADCSVGKITKAASTNVAAGRVISSKPKAKSHVAYKAKVALVVSKG